jgi:ribosomal protein L11 methyltransferase
VWVELSFIVEGALAERWSDALLESGALSVEAEDADADSPAEVALYGEPGEPAPADNWAHTRLAALFERGRAPETLIEEAALRAGQPSPSDWRCVDVAEQDWVRMTQAQFEPIEIGTRLLIAPSWHVEAITSDRQGARAVIELDPGLAFGTGSHPTTRMCLEWVDRHLPRAATVIDYGCGSGILAIAAARLGAAEVLAVDIDPQAVDAARANARINRVIVRCAQAEGPIEGRFGVVLANILANPLRVLAPLLSALVAPGGTLVLAGLLVEQVEEIASYYPDIALGVFAEREGWACLVGNRKA